MRRLFFAAAFGTALGYTAVRCVQAARFFRDPDATIAYDAETDARLERGLRLVAWLEPIVLRAAVAAYVAPRLETPRDAEEAMARSIALRGAIVAFEFFLTVPNRFVEHYVFKRRAGEKVPPPVAWLVETYKIHFVAVALEPFVAEPVRILRRRAPVTFALTGSLMELLLSILNAIVWERQAATKPGAFDTLDEPLATELRALAVRCGRRPERLVRVASDDAAKFFPACASGWFSRQHILLDRRTVRLLTRRQLLWVAAHELGHIVAGDRLRFEAAGFARTVAIQFGLLAVFYVRNDRFDTTSGSLRASFTASVLRATGDLGYNAFRRTRERAADAFATKVTGDPLAGANVHRRFIAWDRAAAGEPRWYNAIFGEHPPTRERLHIGRAAYRAGRTYLGANI